VWPTSREGCRLFFCRGRASYFETLYLLGEQDRVVGISGYVVRPPQARREKPRVSAFTSANIDKILALRPDLVLTFSDLRADIAADLIRRGLAVLSFNQRSVAGDPRYDPDARRFGGGERAGRAARQRSSSRFRHRLQTRGTPIETPEGVL